MIIKGLSLKEHNGRHRVMATVLYEDIAREAVEILFEVPGEYRDFLKASYEGFLFAAFPAALYHHEKRIRIEGEICPEAVTNVTAALYLQKSWHEPDVSIPVIEAHKEKVQRPLTDGMAGCFMSGGVDSLSNFCRNVTTYPADHPKRFKVAIFVYGMDVGGPHSPPREDVFHQTVEAINAVTSPFGCKVLPVYTNVRHLESAGTFYTDRQVGPVLASVGHSLANGLLSATIALDCRSDQYVPTGLTPQLNQYFPSSYLTVDKVMDAYRYVIRSSHPHLNKYLSSSYMTIESAMDSFTRLEKYRFFKEVPVALKALRVCFTFRHIRQDQINCGRCSKCIRTQLELLANGLLEQSSTFPKAEVTADDLEDCQIVNGVELGFVAALVGPLKQAGHGDLAAVLEKQIRTFKDTVERAVARGAGAIGGRPAPSVTGRGSNVKTPG